MTADPVSPQKKCRFRNAAAKAVVLILMSLLISGQAIGMTPQRHPEPDPPCLRLVQPSLFQDPVRTESLPALEWTYHKTADSAHPDGNEQQMLWLMNRARANPAAEGAWLADTGEPTVVSAIDYFQVDTALLQQEFAALAAKPPAAFDVRLFNAALAHSLDLIARDSQDHDNQFQRVEEAGFSYTVARGFVFAYAENSVHAHAGFNIDWGLDGGDGSGMQPGRGHRMAIMSVEGDCTNAGIAVVADSSSATDVGPLVVTGNTCSANTGAADHFNRFIVGTVWEDRNRNDLYDPGEGLGSVEVMPDRGAYFAVTSAGGGYAIPASVATTYRLVFSGAGLADAAYKDVTVNSDSVLADLVVGADTGSPGGTDGGYNLTSSLWANAVLKVSGSPVTLVWQAVGTETTPSGDRVVSGYFYADPGDFAYGSQYNPEVFVKVYIATNGWCNIAFNHVTVDDVTVSSAHQYAGAADQTDTATLTNRLVEHRYTGVAIERTP